MKKNIGKIDKVLRLLIAAALFVIGLTAPAGAALKGLLFVFSAVALFTAIFGF